jgi:hypothetical protein
MDLPGHFQGQSPFLQSKEKRKETSENVSNGKKIPKAISFEPFFAKLTELKPQARHRDLQKKRKRNVSNVS